MTANSPNAAVLPYFAVFIALWSALLLKHWQRVEKTTALEWGMVGFEEEEGERPQFTGQAITYLPNSIPFPNLLKIAD